MRAVAVFFYSLALFFLCIVSWLRVNAADDIELIICDEQQRVANRIREFQQNLALKIEAGQRDEFIDECIGCMYDIMLLPGATWPKGLRLFFAAIFNQQLTRQLNQEVTKLIQQKNVQNGKKLQRSDVSDS